jgi:TonB-linked SusC/RagA family outer membrane protein
MKNVLHKKNGLSHKNKFSGDLKFVKSLFVLPVILFFFISVSFAQSKKISGTITDDKGVPLSNVSVKIKGSSIGVTTDSVGLFSINVPNEKAVLVVSYIGFQDQEVTVGNKNSVDVRLAPSSSQLTDVVVVGYGTQKKVTVTGAVAQVKGSELENSPTVNLSNALAGRLPGITAVQSSGEPGYDGSTIRIRGTNTLGNNAALIVIDGVPDRAGGLERLNPADIETMSVLKDASAAIYGSRAANGVILITTKHGKSGKAVLSYDFNHGWAQPTIIPEMSDAPEYAEMNNELVLFSQVPADQWDAGWAAFKETGTYTRTDNGAVVNAPYQPDAIQKYKDGSDPWGHPNTDWFKSTLKDWSPQSRHNLQISGGSENIRYLASLGYINQDAYYKNSATGYKQYDMRINVDARINKYINTSIGVTAREEYRFFPTSSAGSIFRMLIRGKPTETAIWPNGLPGPDIENGENPVVITTNQTGYDRDKRDFFQANGRIEILIPGVEGLKISGSAAVDKYIQRVKTWSTPWYLYFWDGTSYEPDGVTPLLTKNIRSTFTDPRLNESDENRLNINLTGLINYDRKFGVHTLNLLAGVTKETIDDDNFSAYRRYYISSAIDQLFAGGDEEKNADGGAYERARLSYFGRVGYNYKEKYLAEFVWRYDGSYIFPPGHRFGFFPGILVGWRISEENFWKGNITFINNLKLRFSWGQLGAEPYFDYDRDGVPDLVEYQYLPTYGFGRYVISDQVHKTLYETRVINPDFTWEVTNNTNVGLEGSLLQGKIDFEFEYFYNKRNNILWRRQGSTPGSTGINDLLPPENIGKVENKGWEFKVGYHGQTGNFRYNVSVNGGYAENKVLYFDEPPGAPEWQKATGHPFGTGTDDGTAYLAYEYDGVFRDLKEIGANTMDYSALVGDLRPGDMKFRDINNDGKIDGMDQIRLDKTAIPKFTGGLNINLLYKNFDCSILFQGATGGLLWIRGAQEGDFGNYLQYTYDHRWSVENPSSVDPRVSNRNDTYYTGGGAGNNTYYLRNSDYLRLKNVEIGYTLAERISRKAGISNLRVYAGGSNLITWDEMKLWDPESTSGNGHYYPQSRILNLGFRVTF